MTFLNISEIKNTSQAESFNYLKGKKFFGICIPEPHEKKDVEIYCHKINDEEIVYFCSLIINKIMAKGL